MPYWILYSSRNDEHPHYAIVTLPFLLIKMLEGFILLFNTFPSTFFSYKQISLIRCLNWEQLFSIKCLLNAVGNTLNFTFPPPWFEVILQTKFFNGLISWLTKESALLLLYFQNLSTPNLLTFYYLFNNYLPSTLNYFTLYFGFPFVNAM